MAEVDGLKEINDHQGHAAGDALLKRAAAAESLPYGGRGRPGGGGDEFAAILPDTAEYALEEAMERLEVAIAARQGNRAPALRLSIGAATATSEKESMEAWRLADERMYRQKKGRTCRKAPGVSRENATGPTLCAPR